MALFACPIVAPDDDGIHPAGKPDACFYCQRRVGHLHKFGCVMCEVERTYRVILNGVDIGTWSRRDPVSWDARMRAFHKNDSSWCVDNMRHEGILNLRAPLPSCEGDRCLCSRVVLEPVANEPEYEEAPSA